MTHRWIGILLLGLAPQALAFDDTDAGVDQTLDAQGELTENVFRILQKPEGWRLEDRQPDGSWKDVTCQGGCPLHEASISEIEDFFKARTPQNVTNHCLRNDAFAFCRIERTSSGHVDIGHALVLLVEGESYPLRVRPLGKGPPGGAPGHGLQPPPGPAPDPGDGDDGRGDPDQPEQTTQQPLENT